MESHAYLPNGQQLSPSRENTFMVSGPTPGYSTPPRTCPSWSGTSGKETGKFRPDKLLIPPSFMKSLRRDINSSEDGYIKTIKKELYEKLDKYQATIDDGYIFISSYNKDSYCKLWNCCVKLFSNFKYTITEDSIIIHDKRSFNNLIITMGIVKGITPGTYSVEELENYLTFFIQNTLEEVKEDVKKLPEYDNKYKEGVNDYLLLRKYLETNNLTSIKLDVFTTLEKYNDKIMSSIFLNLCNLFNEKYIIQENESQKMNDDDILKFDFYFRISGLFIKLIITHKFTDDDIHKHNNYGDDRMYEIHPFTADPAEAYFKIYKIYPGVNGRNVSPGDARQANHLGWTPISMFDEFRDNGIIDFHMSKFNQKEIANYIQCKSDDSDYNADISACIERRRNR